MYPLLDCYIMFTTWFVIPKLSLLYKIPTIWQCKIKFQDLIFEMASKSKYMREIHIHKNKLISLLPYGNEWLVQHEFWSAEGMTCILGRVVQRIARKLLALLYPENENEVSWKQYFIYNSSSSALLSHNVTNFYSFFKYSKNVKTI